MRRVWLADGSAAASDGGPYSFGGPFELSEGAIVTTPPLSACAAIIMLVTLSQVRRASH
jgi:hypothetical protein